jgi:hypothetical protein
LDFNAEYLLLPDNKKFGLLTLSQVVSIPQDAFDGSPYVMTNYRYMQRNPNGVRLNFTSLIEREQLEAWLYAHFLKLALPTRRPRRNFSLIYAPLNTTMMFRVVVRLYEIGYPSHWLSTVLHNITNDVVVTAARAPHSYPVARKDVYTMEQNKKKRTCVKPFAAEFGTLTALFTSFLPFGVISAALPSISNVHRYYIQFPPFKTMDGMHPVFILVFFNTTLPFFSRITDLRRALLDDEEGDSSAGAKKLRENGIVIVTTLKWTARERRAEFWMRNDEVDRWNGEVWEASLWRTDDWSAVSSPVRINGGIVKMDDLFSN